MAGIYFEEWRGQAVECLVGGGEDGDGSGQGEDVDQVRQLQQRHEDGELGADLKVMFDKASTLYSLYQIFNLINDT